MNVKAGQKAIIVKSTAGNEGKIVDVLEYLGEEPTYGNYDWAGASGPWWLVSCSNGLSSRNILDGGISNHPESAPVPDAWLRPISDIPDEEYENEQIKLLENV